MDTNREPQTTQVGADERRFFKGWDATPPGSWDVGAGRYPGSLTPDYRMGMLRIPQECASCGCGGKGDAEI